VGAGGTGGVLAGEELAEGDEAVAHDQVRVGDAVVLDGELHPVYGDDLQPLQQRFERIGEGAVPGEVEPGTLDGAGELRDGVGSLRDPDRVEDDVTVGCGLLGEPVDEHGLADPRGADEHGPRGVPPAEAVVALSCVGRQQVGPTDPHLGDRAGARAERVVIGRTAHQRTTSQQLGDKFITALPLSILAP
jgi:hypothetical protein